MIKPNQEGFTILELLIASMVFSVIFLGATTAIIQVGKLYYKGVVTGRTQETVRALTDSVTQQLQFGSGNGNIPAVAGDTPVTIQYYANNISSGGTNISFYAYCLGTTRYTFVLNGQVNSSILDARYDPDNFRLQHALWRDSVANGSGASCVPANLTEKNPSLLAGGTNGKEMLGENMRLTKFDLLCNAVSNVCNFDLRVIYGDNDLMIPIPDSNTVPTGPDATNIPTKCGAIIGSQWCAMSELKTTVLRRVGV